MIIYKICRLLLKDLIYLFVNFGVPIEYILRVESYIYYDTYIDKLFFQIRDKYLMKYSLFSNKSDQI